MSCHRVLIIFGTKYHNYDFDVDFGNSENSFVLLFMTFTELNLPSKLINKKKSFCKLVSIEF